MMKFQTILSLLLVTIMVLPAHAQTPVPTSELTLTWQDNSNNETGFDIERGDNANGPWTVVHKTAADVQTWKDVGLPEARAFCYHIRAFNDIGVSAYSNTMCATTNATLTVQKVGGDAAGRVTSSPAGLDCGATCSGKVPGGNLITLVATPNAGFLFEGWSGPCSGTGNCDVQMDGTTTVTANFSPVPPPTAPLILEIKGRCTIPGECMITLTPILQPAPVP
jgi:uncharacterized repeat protein (TIGR02543 family)